MIDCDFIPDDYHRGRSQRRAVKLRGTLVSAMVVIMVLWVVANRHQISSANAMLTDVAAQREQFDQHLAKREAMETEQSRLRDHQRLLEEFEGPASLVVVICDISRRLPETVVLTNVTYRSASLNRYGKVTSPETPPAKAPATIGSPAAKTDADGAPPTTTEIRMTAFASEVPEAIRCAAELERSPLVARVQMELKGDAVWAGRRGQQFELICELLEQTGVRP